MHCSTAGQRAKRRAVIMPRRRSGSRGSRGRGRAAQGSPCSTHRPSGRNPCADVFEELSLTTASQRSGHTGSHRRGLLTPQHVLPLFKSAVEQPGTLQAREATPPHLSAAAPHHGRPAYSAPRSLRCEWMPGGGGPHCNLRRLAANQLCHDKSRSLACCCRLRAAFCAAHTRPAASGTQTLAGARAAEPNALPRCSAGLRWPGAVKPNQPS